MADTIVQDAPAASSPATPTFEVPTGDAYAEWRQTGKIPAAKPAPPAAQPKPEKSASPNSEKPAPAPEAGNNQERKQRSNAETRLNELLDSLKDAGLTPAQLKTFKQDWKRADQQSAQQPTQDQAKPPATAEKTDKPAGPERPKRPKMADFTTIDEYEAAMDKYETDLDAFNESRAELKAQQQTAARSMHEKMQAAAQRYGDTAVETIRETAKTISGDQQIPVAVKALLDQSPVMTDLLYVMGSKPEDLAALVHTARTDPGAAIRKIVLLEQLVKEELGKGTSGQPGRGEDGKFTGKDKPAPETKVSKAPDPPAEVAGRGSTPPDEIDSAVKTNDFSAFRNAGNRRDIARRQGR